MRPSVAGAIVRRATIPSMTIRATCGPLDSSMNTSPRAKAVWRIPHHASAGHLREAAALAIGLRQAVLERCLEMAAAQLELEDHVGEGQEAADVPCGQRPQWHGAVGGDRSAADERGVCLEALTQEVGDEVAESGRGQPSASRSPRSDMRVDLKSGKWHGPNNGNYD